MIRIFVCHRIALFVQQFAPMNIYPLAHDESYAGV
jgi:hypothetical protein